MTDTKSINPTQEKRNVAIVRTEDTLGGKPRLEERRISVLQIAEMYIDGGTSPEIIADELEIGLDEVHGVLAYYYKHPDEMNEIRDRQRELQIVQQNASAFRRRMNAGRHNRCLRWIRNIRFDSVPPQRLYKQGF